MRSVLITGASSGIGRATALRLDAYGWRVFAGIRSPRDADSLSSEASSHLQTIFLDVADDDSIESAAREVLAHLPDGLDGLVNNAGVAIQGPLEHIDRETLGHQFDVNVSGQITVTQRFLSALRTAGGRIVFVSSVQGVLESIPLFGPYCASKRALEAIAEGSAWSCVGTGSRFVSWHQAQFERRYGTARSASCDLRTTSCPRPVAGATVPYSREPRRSRPAPDATGSAQSASPR